jgi:hypothetical protein
LEDLVGHEVIVGDPDCGGANLKIINFNQITSFMEFTYFPQRPVGIRKAVLLIMIAWHGAVLSP